MYRITAVLLIVLASLFLAPVFVALGGDAQTLRFAVSERRPLFFLFQGEPAGLEADLAETLAVELGMRAEFVPCSGAQCLDVVSRGEADVAAGVERRPGLGSRLVFVSPSYARRADTVFYRLVEARPADRLLHVRGRMLGVLRDSALPMELERDRLTPRRGERSAARLFKLLLAGTIELAVMDERVGDAAVEALALEGRVVKCEYRLAGGAELFFVFGAGSRHLARAGAFEERLRELERSGALSQLRARHLQNDGATP